MQGKIADFESRLKGRTYTSFGKTTAEQNSSQRGSTELPPVLDEDGALELLLDPITGSKAKGKTVEGIVTIHVDDAFMTGTPAFKRKVVEALRKDFKVGSEDIDDYMFVGQRFNGLMDW